MGDDDDVVTPWRRRGLPIAALVLSAGLGVACAPIGAPFSATPTVVPIGAFERVARLASGDVTVSGWAAFPNVTRPVSITINANNRSVSTALAITDRADIGAAVPVVGAVHGFAITLPAAIGSWVNGPTAIGSALTGQVCAIATDPVTGAVAHLGCRQIPGGPTPKGVVVPANAKIDWNESIAVSRSGVAAYASSPVGSAACTAPNAAGFNPISNPSPSSVGQANRCLSWYRGSDGQHPTIVWIHGGSWAGGGAEPVPGPVLRYVGMGWTVVAVQYRFAGCTANQFPTPITDVQDAIAYIKTNALAMGVNPDQMLLFGFSAGAQMAALIGAGWNDPTGHLRVGPQYKVAGWVAVSGMEDMGYFSTTSAFRYIAWWFIPSTPPLRPDCSDGATSWRPATGLLEAASPSFLLDAADPPGFIVHGGNDAITPSGPASTAMGAAMVAAGRPNAIWNEMLPDGGHIAPWNRVWMDSFLSQAAALHDPIPPPA